MRSGTSAAVLLLLWSLPAPADAVAIVGVASADPGGEGAPADFEAYLNQHAGSSQSALLPIAAVNPTAAAFGGYLTGYAFNDPRSLIASVALDEPLFGLFADRDVGESDRGDGEGIDAGAATGSAFLGSQDRLQPGPGRLFSFGLTGAMLDTLNVNGFIAELVSHPSCCDYFLARFTSVDDGRGGAGAIAAGGTPAAPPAPPAAETPPAPEDAPEASPAPAPPGTTPRPPISFNEPPPTPTPPPGKRGAPEPSTVILLGSAFVALAWYRRRRS